MRRYLVLLICFLFLISSVGFAQKSAKKRDYVKFDTARFAKGDIDGAISYFNKVIAVNPQFVAVGGVGMDLVPESAARLGRPRRRHLRLRPCG